MIIYDEEIFSKWETFKNEHSHLNLNELSIVKAYYKYETNEDIAYNHVIIEFKLKETVLYFAYEYFEHGEERSFIYPQHEWVLEDILIDILMKFMMKKCRNLLFNR